MSPRRVGIAGLGLAICSLVVGTVLPAAAADRVVFTITAPEITESSALAVSTVRPKLVYTINDSGDDANVYVLDSSDGELVGTTSLAGVDARDIEAIATGTDGKLVVADIGDNKGDHPSMDIYLIDQPGPGDQQVEADEVSLTYANGPRDAEAILYDADSGRVYVISKQFGGAKVFRTQPNVFSQTSAVLKPVAPAPGLATDATFLPGGDVAVIRTYFNAVAYDFPSWKKITDFELPRQQQGESITAPARGEVVWVGSEGPDSQVLAVPLPDLTPVEPTPPATSTPSSQPSSGSSDSASSDNEGLKQAARVVIVGAGGALAALVVLGVFLYRRHQPHD